MKISAIIPSYCYGKARIEPALYSFIDSLAPDELIVVHDRPDVEFMQEGWGTVDLAGVENVQMVSRSGFAKTCNEGAKKATGDILVFLNTDLIIKSQHTDEVLRQRFNEDPKLGIVGAKLLFPNGTIQHAGGCFLWDKTRHYGWKQPDSFIYDSPFYPHFVTGAFFAVRRECWELLGGFKERFFFGCEDSAFCLDAWESDWKVLYEPQIQGMHMEGGTRNSLHPMDREFVQLAFAASDRMLKANLPFRPWNQIFKTIWEANRSMYPNQDVGKTLILERTGAMGDVVNLTALLPSLAENHSDWKIEIRTQYPDVFRDNPLVDRVGETVIHPLARMVTLNMAHESRPEMNIAEAQAKELELAGFCTKPGQISIFSDELDEGAHLAKYREFFPCDYVVVHPSVTHWKNRNMPSWFWREVVHGLKALRKQVVLCGSEKDLDLKLEGVLDLRGETTFHGTHRLIEGAQLFIGSDSGPLHIAQGTKTPRIGVFTVADPITRFLGDLELDFGVVPSKGCALCMTRQKAPIRWLDCPENNDYECTKNVDPKDVIQVAKNILGQKKTGEP